MLRQIIAFVSIFVAAAVGHQVQFLHSPFTIYLPESAQLRSFDIPKITRQLLGLSADTPSGWRGRGDVLSRPEGALVMHVRGVETVVGDSLLFTKQIDDVTKAVHSYEIDDSPLDDEAFHLVSADIETKFDDKKGTVVHMGTKAIQTFGADGIDWHATVDGIKTKRAQLHDELTNMKRLQNYFTDAPTSLVNGVPDLFVLDVNGARGELTTEEVTELKHSMKQLARAFVSTYNGNCVVELIISDRSAESHSRRKRAADNDVKIVTIFEDVAAGETGELTMSGTPRDEDFPAMFSIILFTSLTLILIVFFVTVSFWFMDPGKDTIIYRMTATRAKVD